MNTVTIDDYADPKLSPEAASLFTAMADMGPAMPLEADALLAAAAQETGLSDFGDPWFLEPFRLVCADAAGAVTPAGRTQMSVMLTQLLKNRLLIEDTIRRHPEILEVEINAPLVIAGLPRTGTTHLHNLLAADPGLRHLPYWEALEPVAPRGEVWTSCTR
jgi:GAF domain-containing protein